MPSLLRRGRYLGPRRRLPYACRGRRRQPRSCSSIRPTGSGASCAPRRWRAGDGHRRRGVRRPSPEVPALLAELGLGGLQIGTTGCARPSTPGGIHPLPPDTVNGVPGSARSVTGLVDDATVARIAAEPTGRCQWAARCRRRGRRGRRRPVRRAGGGPLGGPDAGRVYAGSAATIGIRAAVPTVAAALDAGSTSLTDACRRRCPAAPRPGVRSHRGRLPGAARRVGAPAGCLGTDRRHPAHRADGTVAAGCCVTPRGRRGARTPCRGRARPAAAWSATAVAPRGGGPDTGGLGGRSGDGLPGGTPLPPQSGVLVATGERLHTKAITLSSRKWGLAREHRAAANVLRSVR